MRLGCHGSPIRASSALAAQRSERGPPDRRRGARRPVGAIRAVFLYRLIERELAADLPDKLRDLAHMGAHAIAA